MDLARTQLVALITKAITTALGIIQSIIIVRILSPAEFGLVGLVMSIGGVIGVSQHLGIVDGAIREIAVLHDKREIGKVSWVSHLTRQAVTVPLSLLLVVFAGLIATRIYNRPEIIPYIQIFAGILILQGLQDVLGATLTGMKKFASLYAVQIITAAINVAVFAYLTWVFGIAGFFWAIVLTTSIMVVFFIAIVGRGLWGYLAWPRWEECKRYGWQVMKVGAYMYASRIFFVVWQRLPLLMLGGILAAEQLGYLNVSLTFGSRLTIIAMALSEVNLSWMSSLFVSKKDEFRQVVTRNMHRVLVVMMMMTLVLLLFTPEILQYVIGAEYLPAEPLIYTITLAFFLYALTDIGTSSVFVSADQPRLRAAAYLAMMAVTGIIIGWLFFARPDPFLAGLAVLAGAVVAYGIMVAAARRVFQVNFLTPQLTVFLAALLVCVGWLFTQPSLLWRIVVFAGLTIYLWREAYASKLLPDIRTLLPMRGSASNPSHFGIVCFAGAAFDQTNWTNRQHMMLRVSQRYPVLYVEPRVWILRYLANHWRHPRLLAQFLRRLVWMEKRHSHLFIKAQANLIPGSREYRGIALFNHLLNRYCVLGVARVLGFRPGQRCMWIYDTEAAEYLAAFSRDTLLYDCVDDHAAQAGVDRNPSRVRQEEDQILRRADLVTVTSKRLYELKKPLNPNTHLVLNAGDVTLFSRITRAAEDPRLRTVPRPRFGTVGALDSYKIDFPLVHQIANQRPGWHFIFIGAPVVDRTSNEVRQLSALPNVHVLGAVAHQQVPEYVQHFDVCVIPYLANTYNEASFPLKFWEFMATGKPIIASGVPELRTYAPLIAFVLSADEFIKAGERALQQAEQGRQQRRHLAAQHSWEKRTEQVLHLLSTVISRRSIHNT